MSDNKNIIKKIKRTVLVVDDEMINREILRGLLSEDYEVLTAENGVEALHTVQTELTPISLILLDINMPLMDGLEFIRVIRKDEQFRRIPIIVATSEKESELRSLELGAVDFITKPYDMPEIILARVNRSIELSEDRMIIQSSERDELTGVYNKPIFTEYVHKMDQYNRDADYDMVVVSIEKFHLFNELYGKEKGDQVLRSLADALKEVARDNDGIVGRLQGDNFVLYIAHQSDYDAILDYISRQMEEHDHFKGLRLRAGVYEVRDKEHDPVDDRIDRAKSVCDEIQSSSQSHFLIFDQERQKATLFKERLSQDVLRAIEEKQFEVYYQPKIHISDGKFELGSAEALIRWNHPEFGFISPGMFVPTFEENGAIRLLDRFVWEQVAQQIRKWRDKFGRIIPVSVNVSRIDMFDSGITKLLDGIVRDAGISHQDMYLEITESAYNNETDQILDILSQFKEAGFMIEIDDFGSGYSSLNTLTSFTFDVLKLDMQFVRDLFKNEKTRKIVDIVADIGKCLKVLLVAEGVETREQVDALGISGYDIIQGYYFSKPLRVSDFEAFVEKEEFKKC